MNNSKVSVCMVTYNHENFIAQAIKSVLDQSLSYDIELVIGDDCSSDSTREILKEYEQKYENVLRVFYNKENVGLAKNFSELLNRCSGKYIAICEGDDFWTDNLKLQKQIDFLETHSEVVLCSHNYQRLNNETRESVIAKKFEGDFFYDQEFFLKSWVTQPVTCIFRNIFRDYTILSKEDELFCDVILFYELLKHGKGYYLNENMASFRILASALSSGLSQWQWFRNHIIMFDYLFKYNPRDKTLLKLSRRYCMSLYIYHLRNPGESKNDFYPLKEYFSRNPGRIEIIIFLFFRLPYYLFRYRIIAPIKYQKLKVI